jgi:hypothetical protein
MGLSSSFDEGDLITDVSWDEEFTKRLFGDLNHDVLDPLDDDKVIIVNNSDEEEEVREENTTRIEDVAISAAVNPTSTASTDADDAPMGVKNDNSDDRTPEQEADGSSGSRDDARLPSASAPNRCMRQACFKDNFNGSTLLSFFLSCAEKLG